MTHLKQVLMLVFIIGAAMLAVGAQGAEVQAAGASSYKGGGPAHGSSNGWASGIAGFWVQMT